MEFAIYQDSVGVVPLWNETHASVEIVDGLFWVKLGSLTPVPTSLFDGSQLWLGITISPDLTELAPRQPLVTVPYGFKSEESDYAAFADTADYAINAPPDDDWVILTDDIYRRTGKVGIGRSSDLRCLQPSNRRTPHHQWWM
jgi:hypothetical protein